MTNTPDTVFNPLAFFTREYAISRTLTEEQQLNLYATVQSCVAHYLKYPSPMRGRDFILNTSDIRQLMMDDPRYNNFHTAVRHLSTHAFRLLVHDAIAKPLSDVGVMVYSSSLPDANLILQWETELQRRILSRNHSGPDENSGE